MGRDEVLVCRAIRIPIPIPTLEELLNKSKAKAESDRWNLSFFSLTTPESESSFSPSSPPPPQPQPQLVGVKGLPITDIIKMPFASLFSSSSSSTSCSSSTCVVVGGLNAKEKKKNKDTARVKEEEVEWGYCPSAKQLTKHPLALLALVPDGLSLFSAGAIAGAASKTLTAPLDRVKLLMQTHGLRIAGATANKGIGFIESIRLIRKEEGIKGYWKGNLPQVIRVLPYSAVQLFSYEIYKTLFRKKDGELSVLGRLAAGACAGMTSTFVTYPLDVLRLRLAVEPGCITMSQVAFNMLREEGIASFYSGLGPSLLAIAPYIAVNFCIFDLVKNSLPERYQKRPETSVATALMSATLATLMCYPLDTVRRQMQMKGSPYSTVFDAFPVQLFSYEIYKTLFRKKDGELSVLGRLAAGACAGMTSTFVTYPLDVLRLRLAVEPGCITMSQVAFNMLREEGIASFYSGLGPSLLAIAPYIAVNFCIFDLVKNSLPERYQKRPETSVATALMSATLATLMCYPLDTVRRQMQMKGSPYSTVFDAFPGILEREGFLGLYRGFVPNALKTLPSSSIRLTTFDTVKGLIRIGKEELHNIMMDQNQEKVGS